MHTHAHTHPHMHAHTHTCAHVHTHTHGCMHTLVYTSITRMFSHTHAHMFPLSDASLTSSLLCSLHTSHTVLFSFKTPGVHPPQGLCTCFSPPLSGVCFSESVPGLARDPHGSSPHTYSQPLLILYFSSTLFSTHMSVLHYFVMFTLCLLWRERKPPKGQAFGLSYSLLYHCGIGE